MHFVYYYETYKSFGLSRVIASGNRRSSNLSVLVGKTPAYTWIKYQDIMVGGSIFVKQLVQICP